MRVHSIQSVSPLPRTRREFLFGEIRQQILLLRQGLASFVVFQSPLLFRAVNLPEIVDAGVDTSLPLGLLNRAEQSLIFGLQLLKLLLLLLLNTHNCGLCG